MQFTTTLVFFIAGATASPLGVSLGGLNVNVASSNGLLGVNLASAKSSSYIAAATKATIPTTTAAPTAAVATQPVMPSSFSAPVQGSGILSLNNLPAMPPVIDKTLSGALGVVYGLSMSTP